MKAPFWLAVVVALCLGQILALMASEMLIVGFVERYNYTIVREEFDDLATSWQRRLSSDGIDLENQIAKLRAELKFDVRKGIFDEVEANEGMGLPETYYVTRDDTGVIVSVILSEDEIVEFGPIPGTFLQSNLEQIIHFGTTVAFSFVGIMLLLTAHVRRVRGVVELADAILDEEKVPDANAPIVERLSDSVANLAQQLRELKIDTSQNINNQRDFLHGVAHEFRAPLARLRFAMDLDDDDGSQRVDRIVEEMDDLITEILDYSKYRHGLFEPNFETTDVAALLRSSLAEFEGDHNIELISGEGVADQERVVSTDRNLLKRCITNLLHNAMRYAKSKVLVELLVDEKNWCVVVEDDGPGVPPGKRRLIFEPFTRLDPSRSRSSGGTGLGLAIVDGIVKKLGGEVSAADGLRLSGARFTIAIKSPQ